MSVIHMDAATRLYRFQNPCRFRRGQKCPLHFFWNFRFGRVLYSTPSFVYTATWTNFLVSKKGSSKVLLSSQVVKGAFTVDSSSVKSPPLR